MVNYKVPVILGVIVIIIFALCLVNNRTIKENFGLPLIGTTNSVIKQNDTTGDLFNGTYAPIVGRSAEVPDFTTFNVVVFKKGNDVSLLVNGLVPKSRLGELCSTNDDCVSGKCDVDGTFHAQGKCVDKNASAGHTGSQNTNNSVNGCVTTTSCPSNCLTVTSEGHSGKYPFNSKKEAQDYCEANGLTLATWDRYNKVYPDGHCDMSWFADLDRPAYKGTGVDGCGGSNNFRKRVQWGNYSKGKAACMPIGCSDNQSLRDSLRDNKNNPEGRRSSLKNLVNFYGNLVYTGRVINSSSGNPNIGHFEILSGPSDESYSQHGGHVNRLKKFFEKGSVFIIEHVGNVTLMNRKGTDETYRKISDGSDNDSNFEAKEINSTRYSVGNVEVPKLTVSSEYCPDGSNVCYDEQMDAMFCGDQESGTTSGNHSLCKSCSIKCALNENKPFGYGMCKGAFTVRSNHSKLPVLSTILNLRESFVSGSGQKSGGLSCRKVIDDLTSGRMDLNHLSIFTHIKNQNNKYEWKSLGTQFFSPGPKNSTLIVQDSPLTNYLNKTPAGKSNYSMAFATFMLSLIVFGVLESVDTKYLSLCRDAITKSKTCHAAKDIQDDLKKECQKVLYDVEDIDAQIANMDYTQFKIVPDRSASTVGPNNCGFYLKSDKNDASLSPQYYSTGHSNGSTSLSLIKGGESFNMNLGGKIFGNDSTQIWFFEDVSHYQIDKSTMKMFRTKIRSSNGLYLEPSFGRVQGFSATGQDNVYEVNLVRKTNKWWHVVASTFDSNTVMELERHIENGAVSLHSGNSGRTTFQCPTSYKNKMGDAMDGYYCCNGEVSGTECTGSKCCLQPGLSGNCSETCCPMGDCPTDMPTMNNGKCYNDKGDSCTLDPTGSGAKCYP